jgi:hypothetical protein
MRLRILAIILALVTASCRPDEPVAGGERLSHWKREARLVSFMTFWNSSKDERRQEAFRRLGEIGEPAVPALMELLQTPNASVSGDAFNTLANLGPRAASATPQLVEMLRSNKPDLHVRAAWILGRIGPAAEPAVPNLAPLLNGHDVALRQAAAQALAQIGGSGRVALDRASQSSDARLREASLRGAAAQSLDAATRRVRIAAALADGDTAVRMRGVELLLSAPRDELDALAASLIAALNDRDRRVRERAHTVLDMFLQRGNGGTPALLAAVVTGGDAPAQATAAWQLGNDAHDVGTDHAYDTPGVSDALLKSLTAPDVKVRIYAARALAYGDARYRQQGLRALRRELPTAEPILAVRGARVLWDAQQDAAEVRDVYEAGLRDADKWNRVETISAIIAMGRDAALFAARLGQLRSDPDPEVRDRAEKALYELRLREGMAASRR